MAIAGGYKRYLSNVLIAEKEKQDKRLEQKKSRIKTGQNRERRPDIARYTVPARRLTGDVEKEIATASETCTIASASAKSATASRTSATASRTSATAPPTSATASRTSATASRTSSSTSATASPTSEKASSPSKSVSTNSLATVSTTLATASTSPLATSTTLACSALTTSLATTTSIATTSMATTTSLQKVTPLETSSGVEDLTVSVVTSSMAAVSTTRSVRTTVTPTPEVKQVMVDINNRLYSDRTVPEAACGTEDEFTELANFLGASRRDGIELLQAVTDPSVQTVSETYKSVAVMILTACQNMKTVKDCTELYFSICKREIEKQKTNNCSRFRFGHMVSRQCFQIAKNSSLVLHSHCVKHLLSFLMSIYRISHQLDDSSVLCRVLATAIHQFISTALKHTDSELFLILGEYVVHENLASELEVDLPVSLCVQLQDLKQKLTDNYHDKYMLLENSRPEC